MATIYPFDWLLYPLCRLLLCDWQLYTPLIGYYIPCADYYSEQKKLEAKELRREAQAKQTEFDVAAKKIAENGLVKTLGMLQF